MIDTDEEALICDFAEYYHIYDYRGLPASYAAILAVGLREDSRIKKKIGGIQSSPPEIYLQAFIADRLNFLSWLFASREEKRRPTLITDMMINGVKEKEELTFKSGADFEAAREKILRDIERRQQCHPEQEQN